jgi:large subunit ribosomal protein L4
MPSVKLVNQQNSEVGEIELQESIFAVEVKPYLMHMAVLYHLAKKRSGNAATKTRGMVRGSGAKPYRQKGTGRARAGSRKSPIWRGGGTVFGPTPRSFAFKLNKKVRRLALASALSQKLIEGNLIVVDNIELPDIKTKAMTSVLKALDANSSLIVTGDSDEKLTKSTRNISGVKVLSSDGINVYDCLRYDKLVILKSALEKIEKRFD